MSINGFSIKELSAMAKNGNMDKEAAKSILISAAKAIAQLSDIPPLGPDSMEENPFVAIGFLFGIAAVLHATDRQVLSEPATNLVVNCVVKCMQSANSDLMEEINKD